MAKSRKQQRAAKQEMAAIAAEQPAPIVQPIVEAPAKPIVPAPKPKPIKKRYVRPARQEPPAAAPTLARGTSFAARFMSSGLKKMIVTPTTDAAPATAPVTTSAALTAGSMNSESTSSRALRRLARRQASES
jgi:hypothetical protein